MTEDTYLYQSTVSATRNISSGYSMQNNGYIRINLSSAKNSARQRADLRDQLSQKLMPSLVPAIADDTCEWILEDKHYRKWQNSTDQHLLWVLGGPGKGKTHVASFLRNHLKDTPLQASCKSRCKPLVLDFFCDNAEVRRNNALAVQLKIISQLAESGKDDIELHRIISFILSNWHVDPRNNVLSNRVWSQVEDVIIKNDSANDDCSHECEVRTYLILDRLDECDYKSIQYFLQSLDSFCKSTRLKGRRQFKAVVFTRPLSSKARKKTVIDLDDSVQYKNQMHNEIKRVIEWSSDSFVTALSSNLEKEAFKNDLVQKSNGTFLWVASMIKLLQESPRYSRTSCPDPSQHILDGLMPGSLSSVYDRMLLEMLEEKYGKVHNFHPAKCAQVIRIVKTAAQPLTLDQLKEALDVSEDVLVPILDSCQHIIYHIPDEGLQLMHASLGDYLAKRTWLTMPASVGLHMWPIFATLVDVFETISFHLFYLEFIICSLLLLLISYFAWVVPQHSKPVSALLFITAFLLLLGFTPHMLRQTQSPILRKHAELARLLLNLCVFGVFSFSESEAHGELFSKSLNHLMDKKRGLQGKDDMIFRKQSRRSRVKSEMGFQGHQTFTNYACLYWSDHASCLYNTRSKAVQKSYEDVLLKFFEEYFLHWVVNLSYHKETYSSVRAIRKVNGLSVGKRAINNRSLQLLLLDAEKFVMRFAPIIERAPLQAYSSALAFSPKNSIIRERLWSQALPLVKEMDANLQHWPPLIRRMDGHSASIKAMTFCSDGDTIAFVTAEPALRFWSASSGSWATKKLECHSKEVRAAIISPNCKLALSFTDKGEMLRFPMPAGDRIRKLRVRGKHITNAGISPLDSSIKIALRSRRNSIQILDLEQLHFQVTVDCEYNHGIDSLALSRDGQSMATVSPRIRLWNLQSQSIMHTFDFINEEDFDYQIAFSPNGRFIASGTCNGNLRLWEVCSGNHVWTRKAHRDKITSLEFSPESLLVATASSDYTVQLWDAKAGNPVRKFTNHTSTLSHVSFSPDGRVLASASTDGAVYLWECPTKTDSNDWKEDSGANNVRSMVNSEDGKLIAAVHADNSMKLWKMSTGFPVLQIHSYKHVRKVEISPDGSRLALTQYTDNAIYLWHIARGGKEHRLSGHRAPVESLVFSKDSRALLSATYKDVRFWNTRTGKQRRSVYTHDDTRFTPLVAFASDGRAFAFATTKGKISLLKKETEPKKSLVGHTAAVTAMKFSSCGSKLASASNDHTLRIWHVDSGDVYRKIELNAAPVSSLCFSQNDQAVLYSAHGYGIMTWDLSKSSGNGANSKMDKHGYSRLSPLSCGGCVATDFGKVNLRPDHDDHSMFVAKSDIFSGGKRVLDVPPNLAVTCAVYANGFLAVGLCPGGVMFVPFATQCDLNG